MLHPTPHERRGGSPIVRFVDVHAGYSTTPVLEDVDLTVMPGDFVGILGPSGSGKTTLLRTILGATRLLQGEVTVRGVSTAGHTPRAGYVPQLETIDWTFPVSVEEVVLMGRAMNNPFLPWHGRDDKRIAREMLERLGIADLAKRQIRNLSGGQQQRAFLARALVSSPDLLLLDEPTRGVDIKTRDEVMHLLHDLNHQGITILLTTHEINAVAVHLPWVICVNGRIIAEGPPVSVINEDVLAKTYGAAMPVIEYEGMPLVAERPHLASSSPLRDKEQHSAHHDNLSDARNGSSAGQEPTDDVTGAARTGARGDV